jgi:sarcosine oxidase subunit gamma
MAETLFRTLPIDGARQAAGQHGRAALRAMPPTTQLAFRGQGAAVDLAGAAFTVALPVTPCRAVGNETRAALWLGPDEWLLLASEMDQSAILAELAQVLEGVPHALLPISHRNVALEITGPDAALVLNSACPLDLYPPAFPVGMCTRTILGKAQIVLWRTHADRFHIIAWRSFAPYVWDILVEARARL